MTATPKLPPRPFSIPGGLFEVALGVWLLTRGFTAGADESGSTVVATPSARPAPVAA
jgi:hypothetical protein